jgi:hypothetical protein
MTAIGPYLAHPDRAARPPSINRLWRQNAQRRQHVDVKGNQS